MLLEREQEEIVDGVQDETLGPPQFTRQEMEILFLVAQGLTHPQVAEKVKRDASAVGYHLTVLHLKLGVGLGQGRTAKVIFKAVELGILDLDELAEEFKLSPEAKFTRRELEVLELMTQVEGPATSEDIKEELVVSRGTVEFHKTNIHRKFGTHSNIQAGLRYLAAKRDGLI